MVKEKGIPYPTATFEVIRRFCTELNKALKSGKKFNNKKSLVEFCKKVVPEVNAKDIIGLARSLGLIGKDNINGTWIVARHFKASMDKRDFVKLVHKRIIGFREFIEFCKMKRTVTVDVVLKEFLPILEQKGLRRISDNTGTREWTARAYINVAKEVGYIIGKEDGTYIYIGDESIPERITKVGKEKERQEVIEVSGIIGLTSGKLYISGKDIFAKMFTRYQKLYSASTKDRHVKVKIVNDRLLIDLSPFKT